MRIFNIVVIKIVIKSLSFQNLIHFFLIFRVRLDIFYNVFLKNLNSQLMGFKTIRSQKGGEKKFKNI